MNARFHAVSLTMMAALAWSAPALAQDEPANAPQPVEKTDPQPTPAPTPAFVAAPAPAAESSEPAPRNYRHDRFMLNVGLRENYVKSAGFDPYSTNDVLPQFSVGIEAPVLVRGKLALAVGAAYSGGGASSSMRGDSTHLFAHQLSVPIEGRYHFAPWGWAFVRVAPGATGLVQSLTDSSSPNTLSSTAWAFSTDVSAGASILLGPRAPDADGKRIPRFWMIPEVGYGFATRATFKDRPDRDPADALGTDERTAVPSLALNAFFWRLAVATTF